MSNIANSNFQSSFCVVVVLVLCHFYVLCFVKDKEKVEFLKLESL